MPIDAPPADRSFLGSYELTNSAPSTHSVGGETLDLALQYINTAGRIIACGAVSRELHVHDSRVGVDQVLTFLDRLAEYNLKGDERYGLKNTMNVVSKQLTYRGFIMVSDPHLVGPLRRAFPSSRSAFADGMETLKTPDKNLEKFHAEMPGLVESGKIK